MSGETHDQFTYSHDFDSDGTLRFLCGTDPELWPWLKLDPFDPIVVQTLNYYVAYESAIARKQYEPGQWSALTYTDWSCGASGVGHAVRGVVAPQDAHGDLSYLVDFYDRDDAWVYRMTGTGVAFKNRDFEAWRAEQKQALGAPFDADQFPFVAAADVGMNRQSESYLAPLLDSEGSAATALVTAVNGFPPEHPYHDGSGDHVNAGHLADVVRQYLRLRQQDPHMMVLAGEMHFYRYVELGYPFSITADSDSPTVNGCAVTIQQGGVRCARISLNGAPG